MLGNVENMSGRTVKLHAKIYSASFYPFLCVSVLASFGAPERIIRIASLERSTILCARHLLL